MRLIDLDGRYEASLHLKLPPDTPLAEAEATVARIEAAVRDEAPEVTAVHAHLEPLEAAASAARAQHTRDAGAVLTAAVLEGTGIRPSDLRLVAVEHGLMAYLTLALPGGTSLAEAHEVAGRARRLGRESDPAIVDVFVQTVAEQRPG